MERDHGPSAESAASCHTMRWTIVLRVAQSWVQGGQPVLAELCRLYEEAANQLELSAGAAKTFIYRMRERDIAVLHEKIGAIASGPAEIDKEIHALCEALVGSEGRVGS